ncbi:MAG TPA: isochorismatase family cysteine hydrolase [Acidimicrobiales bacterium]|nr:isochorismatase family cysteine hydrolase [Acidimicrobiales bacterium]
MALELSDLVGAGQAAVVTMELQRGVVGDLSSFPALAEEVDRVGVIANTARLLAGARRAGAPVVHCTAGFRADRLGSPVNAPLIATLLHRPDHLLEDTGAVELVAALGAEPSDLVSHRRHGVSPFIGTTLDPTLRAAGVSTVVATGVSLNLGIIGLAVEAVNFGYRVVIATDAVAGVPSGFADEVLRHTLPLVARLAPVDDIIEAFGP